MSNINLNTAIAPFVATAELMQAQEKMEYQYKKFDYIYENLIVGLFKKFPALSIPPNSSICEKLKGFKVVAVTLCFQEIDPSELPTSFLENFLYGLLKQKTIDDKIEFCRKTLNKDTRSFNSLLWKVIPNSLLRKGDVEEASGVDIDNNKKEETTVAEVFLELGAHCHDIQLHDYLCENNMKHLDLFMQNNANPNFLNKAGNTPLHHIATNISSVWKTKHLDILKHFATFFPDPFIKNQKQLTPREFAIKERDLNESKIKKDLENCNYISREHAMPYLASQLLPWNNRIKFLEEYEKQYSVRRNSTLSLLSEKMELTVAKLTLEYWSCL